MHVGYMVLADATAAENGKHYIHGGGWDRIFAATFPVIHSSLSVALQLRVPWHDTNQRHELELDVVDADGQSILPTPPGLPRGTVTVGRPPDLEEGDDQNLPLVFTITQLRFERAGTYAVLVRIDGMEAARSAFRVVDMQLRARTRG
jgi:hypothetical protein